MLKVIETQSSMGSDEDMAQLAQPDPMFDERLMSNNILPEKEEIVSTTPDIGNESEELVSEAQDHITVSSALETTRHEASAVIETSSSAGCWANHRGVTNHQTSDEDLVEMIMKDSELNAWIAKARLRPRTQISYNQTRKKRRKSRSRSSSVHD